MALLDSYFSLHNSALQLRNTRLELISQNIANAATPNYRAKDLDFAAAMRKAEGSQGMQVRNTDEQHLGSSGSGRPSVSNAIVYRVPLNPSRDNNTVEIGLEQAKFGRAAADYQASLQFLESRVSGLRKALRGE